VRHSAEHLLADAVRRLWPEAEYDAGRQDHSEKFQYDFRFPRAFTAEDLEAIEAKMREIAAEDASFERVEVSRAEAERIFRDMGFNAEARAAEGHSRRRDDHALPARRLHRPLPRAARPARRAGGRGQAARGLGRLLQGRREDERLQRIYGTAFLSAKELAEYLERLEQARARDHRRLGPELGLFSFSPLAPASPFFHPKGAVVYNELVRFVRELQAAKGFAE